jgi:WD40 repeat protein
MLLSPRVSRLDRAARVIEGHRGKVRCAAYSPDGTRIVSGSQDFTIRVWSAVTFEELGRVEGHNLPVTSVIFSPDGGRIVSASEDRTLRIWSTIDLENIATIKGHQALVSSVAVSPDGSRFISGSHDGTVRVWCASSFVELARLEGYGSKALSVAFSPNGDWMLSSWGSTVLVADAHSFKRLAELDKSQIVGQSFGTADFSRDGLHIVASCDDKTVRIWSAITFQEIAVLNHDFTDVSRFALSPDGLLIVSMSRSGRIHVWNSRSYKEVASFQAHEFGSHCVAFSPDGKHFVSGGEDNTLRIWAPGMYDGDTIPFTGYVDRVLFSADCARVMCISVHDTLGQRSGINRTSILRVWRISKWEELGQIGRFSVMALSPDGKSAVTFDRTSGLLRFWNMSTFGSLATAECISNHITSVTYSPDGTRIICGTSGGTIQSWCPINFDKLTEFGAYVDSQHYSPAAFGFDSQYEPDISQDFGPHIIYVLFSTNGTRFVSSTYRHARFWTADTLTLNSLGEISLQEPEISFECMAISHSGTHFVAGLGDKTVRVWSSITFYEHFRVEAHWLFMDQVAFSPDGESFLSLDRESETRAWTRGELNNDTPP